MCVAVAVPAGQRLTEQQLRQMHAANGDSWGIGWCNMYAPSANKPDTARYLTSVKEVTGVDEMIKKYFSGLDAAGPRRAESPHIVHFRIATQGKIAHVNAHPFHINGGLLIHNGHISGANGPSSVVGQQAYSDTYYFAQLFKNELPAGMTDEQKEKLSQLIGGYNKLVILHDDATVSIINEKAGTRLPNGIWVSNTYWQRNYYSRSY